VGGGGGEDGANAAGGGEKGVEASGTPANALEVRYREGESFASKLTLSDGDAVHGSRSTVLEVCVPAGAATGANARLRARQLWGTDVYTADSDIVAVLTHCGYYRPSPAAAPVNLSELRCVVRAASHPEDGYPSTSRNGIRSRAWGTIQEGCGYVVESARAVTTSGASIALSANTSKRKVSPTFYPVEKEHIVHTRNSAANSDRKKGLIREVTIQYNLCNEPWMKYGVSLVADQGFKKSQWTCARLRSEVLYLETHQKRYELSCSRGKVDEEDKFKWALSKKPLPLEKTREVGVPLPKAYVDIVADNLRWDEIYWGSSSIIVRGKEYNVVRLQYIPIE
jgi:hypothetical protein